jgi:hypothetical protein
MKRQQVYRHEAQQCVRTITSRNVARSESLDYHYLGSFGNGGSAPLWQTNTVTGPRGQQPGNSCTWSVNTDVADASF